MPLDFQAKVGPLRTWQWGLVAGGLVGGFLFVRRLRGGNVSESDTAGDYPIADGGSYLPGGSTTFPGPVDGIGGAIDANVRIDPESVASVVGAVVDASSASRDELAALAAQIRQEAADREAAEEEAHRQRLADIAAGGAPPASPSTQLPAPTPAPTPVNTMPAIDPAAQRAHDQHVLQLIRESRDVALMKSRGTNACKVLMGINLNNPLLSPPARQAVIDERARRGCK